MDGLLRQYFDAKERLQNTYLLTCNVCGCADEILLLSHRCNLYLRKKIQEYERQILGFLKCDTFDELMTMTPRTLEVLCELVNACEDYKNKLRHIEFDLSLSDYENIYM